MPKIKFKIAAKTDVGLVRTNNEDNFQASSDLNVKPMRWMNDEVCILGEKGTLLVVADGMGGMNAGEVASQIAIDTIREEFIPENITSDVVKNRFTIEKFMNDVIIKADQKIKDTAKLRPETKGMGTTIVIAWLLAEKLYVSWCGDSRAYVYNPKVGLNRLTKDHSYVQQLVDSGKLSEEEAFDFPDSNIITRCLSDSKQKAQPESLNTPYPVSDNDVILLCTDGLCGMIRDEEIETVSKADYKDLVKMMNNLVQAALNASGADNVTVCLCQVLSGGAKAESTYFTQNKNQSSLQSKLCKIATTSWAKYKTILLCLLFLFIGCGVSWFFMGHNNQESTISDKDSTKIDKTPQKSVGNDDVITNTESKPEREQAKTEEKELPTDINGVIVPNTDKKGKKKSEEQPSEGSSQDDELTSNEGNTNKTTGDSNTLNTKRKVIEVVIPEKGTAYRIGQAYKTSTPDLEKLNPGKDLKHLKYGDKIKVYELK